MGNRRPTEFRQELVQVAYDHAQLTATASYKLFTTQKAFRLDKAEYINPTGLAGHADNHFTLTVVKTAQEMCSYTTDSDVAAEGTITADTFTEIPLDGTDANLVAAAGEVISFTLTEAGTATLPAGRVVIYGRYL